MYTGPDNRSQTSSQAHTPRGHPSNGRPNTSPYNKGKKNNEYINPTYTSKIFNDGQQDFKVSNDQNRQSLNNNNINRSITPKDNNDYNKINFENVNNNTTPKKSGPKSIVSDTSSTNNIDLVCTNCINKHLMREKYDKEQREKEKDQLLRKIAESNTNSYLQKEQEKQRNIKEQYKNDARAQLEQINFKKERDEKVKRSGPPQDNNNFFNEKNEKMIERQNELKNTLLKQMQDKEMEKKMEKLNRDNYKTTIEFNDSYRPKSSNTRNYADELKNQIMMKEQQKNWEKDVNIYSL